jgi:Tfp pilus assembly protein PilV
MKRYYSKFLYPQHNGFVALMAAIIISAMLLMVVTLLSYSGFNSRFNALDFEYKERGSAIAEACADEALLRIARDADYAGKSTSTIGGNQCFIGALTTLSGQTQFTVRAIYQETYTNLKITVATGTLSVISWEEISAL